MAKPLGQPREVLSSTTLSVPSRFARSILGISPQSVQYMYLHNSNQEEGKLQANSEGILLEISEMKCITSIPVYGI